MQQNPFTIFLGGRHTEVVSKSSAGDSPRVDYLELLKRHGASVVDFETYPASDFGPVRHLQQRIGPYWSLAVRTGFGSTGSNPALATGEDIGFPIALLQRLTAAHRPLFIITHGSYLGSRRGAQALQLLRDARHVSFLCLSRSLQTRLVETHHIPPNRALHGGYGVDTCFFSPRPMPAGPLPIVASAGMATRDYKTLAAAVAGLDASVKIAADSAWFRSELDIAGHDLPPNVEARSYGDYVRLRQLYAESSFVVVPLYQSVHACGYAVIAEAMAMGKAVITTDIASRSDYVTEGETGFLVPVGDVGTLRERIQYLLARPELAARMGRQARAQIEARFTLEAYNHRIAQAMGLPTPDPRRAEQWAASA